MQHLIARIMALAAAMSLAGCLGGGASESESQAGAGASERVAATDAADAQRLSVAPKPNETEAARFLQQATFGATERDIAELSRIGYGAWLEQQFAAPAFSHQAQVEAAAAAAGERIGDVHLVNSFWKQAAAGRDQLRGRVAFALSQIFVVSLEDAGVTQWKRGVAAYLDMLGRNAFGNYRTLLEDVSLHPMMGLYLSHLRNQKEDPASNRFPDQNYAREVMQLFSIGLYELNPDGTQHLRDGRPIETYDNGDIVGLSRVFTGFGWAGPDKSDYYFFGSGTPVPDREVKPMQGYPRFHSTEEKRFLNTVIPASSAADPDADLRIALDTLAAHPNVAPFMAKQLIQRLVTSNPSPGYVARVAAAFDAGNFHSPTYAYRVGSGRRGDLRATVAAILLDPEARVNKRSPGMQSRGKVREPVLRFTAWLRAFNARSMSGEFRVGLTDDPATALGMAPLAAPSVFNFYRPGYVPPNTRIAAAGLVAPELQIAHETSVIGYMSFMRSVVVLGAGLRGDIKPDYSAEVALADDPDRLVDRVDLLLTGRTMSSATRNTIRDAVSSLPLHVDNAPAVRADRVHLAVFFALSSPDFLVQK